MPKLNFWFKLALLTIIPLILYANSLQGEFHLDDIPFIAKNPTIRDITNLAAIGKGILSEHARHVVFFSFALNYHLHKLNVFGYHLFNTFIHILTGIAIWQFTRLLLSTSRFQSSISVPAREKIAFFSALLFLCHPVNTQAVSYLSQRFASMATLFYCSSLAFYLKARLTQKLMHSLPFFFLAMASAVLSMLSKEFAITLPITALFIDIFCVCGIFTAAPLEIPKKKKKRPDETPSKVSPGVPILIILGLGALFFIVPALFNFNWTGIFYKQIPSSSHEGDILNFPRFIFTQFRVIATLLRMLVLPYGQNLDHDFPMSHSLFEPITTFLSLFFILSVLATAWYMRRKAFLFTFATIWFTLTYLPEFYPRVHVIFEHKLYLTAIGFYIAFTAFMILREPFREATTFFLVALAFLLGGLTIARNNVWRTEQSLWEDVVKKSPNKYRANLNLGNVYQLQGKYDEALPYYDQAIKVMPFGYKALNSRAVLYYMKGRVDLALADLNRSIQANPEYDDPYNNRGNIRRQRGEIKESIEDYTKAIAVSQFAPVAYKNRGDAYGQLGQLNLALKDYNTALNLDPKLKDAYNNMGNLLKSHKKYAEALAVYDIALKNHPANGAEYMVGRGNIFSEQGQHQQALEAFQQALVFRPNMPEALFNAGIASSGVNKPLQADAYYTQAIKVMPTLAVAYNNRGDLRRLQKHFAEAIADFDKANQLSPRNPIILRNLIRTYTEGGDAQKAAEIRAMALQMGVSLDKIPVEALTVPIRQPKPTVY